MKDYFLIVRNKINNNVFLIDISKLFKNKEKYNSLESIDIFTSFFDKKDFLKLLNLSGIENTENLDIYIYCHNFYPKTREVIFNDRNLYYYLTSKSEYKNLRNKFNDIIKNEFIRNLILNGYFNFSRDFIESFENNLNNFFMYYDIREMIYIINNYKKFVGLNDNDFNSTYLKKRNLDQDRCSNNHIIEKLIKNKMFYTEDTLFYEFFIDNIISINVSDFYSVLPQERVEMLEGEIKLEIDEIKHVIYKDMSIKNFNSIISELVSFFTNEFLPNGIHLVTNRANNKKVRVNFDYFSPNLDNAGRSYMEKLLGYTLLERINEYQNSVNSKNLNPYNGAIDEQITINLRALYEYFENQFLNYGNNNIINKAYTFMVCYRYICDLQRKLESERKIRIR